MIDGIWLLLRAASLMLILQAAGAALFLVLFSVPPLPGARIRTTASWVALAAAALLLVQLAFEPAHLAGELNGLTDGTQWRLLAGDSAALAAGVRLLGAALLVGALRWQRSSATALGGLALVIVSFALTGHSLTHPHRAALAVLLLLHVTAVSYWFGALWPLLQLLRQAAPVVAAGLTESFSRVALWLVPLLALAGVTMAALLLPQWGALWRPYGLTLLAKLVLFVALLALAALNRLRLTPALARGVPAAARQLRVSIGLEYLLLCAALAATAALSGYFAPEGT